MISAKDRRTHFIRKANCLRVNWNEAEGRSGYFSSVREEHERFFFRWSLQARRRSTAAAKNHHLLPLVLNSLEVSSTQMLQLQLPPHHPRFLSPHLFPLSPLQSTLSLSPSALPRRRPGPDPSWVARASEPPAAAAAVADEEPPEGPVELPPSAPSIFASTDDPTPLQVATSLLLTGAISVFLFRAVRRRAKRAKELKFRSSGANKTLKDEALDSLKAMGTASIPAKAPPSPAQALLGGIAAGVIALILYKFTTTVEASLNRQTLPDNFSVRQISVTIRTIVNGICYLATFVFGINSIGLILYSGQLAINSFTEESSSREMGKSDGQLPSAESRTDTPKTNDSEGSDKTDSTP